MSCNIRKVYLSFHNREKFYEIPEMEIPKPLVTRGNTADRSPCRFLKFFFSAVNYFGVNTSPVEIIQNIKCT